MRNQKSILFFGLAIVLGVAASVIAKHQLDLRQIVTPVRTKTKAVVVASVAVPTGTPFTAKQLEIVDWPAEYLPKHVFHQVEDVVGRFARQSTTRGEPILETSLVAEGSEAGLASLIGDEYRAVSVKVDAVIGVAGFVAPGSRVDVMATLRRLDWKKAQPYSKLILQDVRVLAVDQQVEESSAGKPELVSVVTLEVKPRDAQKLTFASHEGHIQLALRNPRDKGRVQLTGVSVSTVVGGLSRPRQSARTSRVELVKGTAISVKGF